MIALLVLIFAIDAAHLIFLIAVLGNQVTEQKRTDIILYELENINCRLDDAGLSDTSLMKKNLSQQPILSAGWKFRNIKKN